MSTPDDSINMHGDKSYYFWTKNINKEAVDSMTEQSTPQLVKTSAVPSSDSLSDQERRKLRLKNAHKVDKFLWFDSDDRVKVHAELEGIKKYKDLIEKQFSDTSFDIFVPDYSPPNGDSPKDLRLWIVDLCHPIDPEQSKLIVKQDKLVVSLKKKDEAQHWYSLRNDARTRPKKKASPKFPEFEEQVLQFWKDIDAFQESLRRNADKPPYTFYDGPPFATGLPHYGHILAGTIKDTVTRYAHQTGHHVSRRFGWDTHGLPVEFEIDKTLGITSRKQVLEMGIDKYNKECRSIVMRYAGEWRQIVTRLGRWIDFDNDYKTLNTTFMESVWWVFKQLFDKGHVYRGFKVMPYSTACTTPLSHFEAGQQYKTVSDPSVVVKFALAPGQDSAAIGGGGDGAANPFLVAWTTTPWTLPSNLALIVNAGKEYVRVRDTASGNVFLMMRARLEQIWPPLSAKQQAKAKGQPPRYEILATFFGRDLVGLKYEPLFPYFAQFNPDQAFRVLADDYVDETAGTGVVHSAPAFGEDDYRVSLANGVITKDGELPCPIDEDGRFVAPVTDFAGQHVKEADLPILKHLKAAGHVVTSSKFEHSYPFCWRSDTPLIYRAVPSWFIRVENVRERMCEHNASTYWVPAFVKEKRFHNWLKNTTDWVVSRTRYWGTPLPLWTSADFKEIVCVGSVAELEKLSGVSGITDLHRDSIDHITIPSKNGGEPLRRVEDVLDCWFESGSMPYAQLHYPFENKEQFESGFPADFIAEGIDQTRGWFYTLLVLSTLLFDKPPFKNLIVNGLVLAADGKKMSKRLKNYPDPVHVVHRYGADAVRLYLINSPVVRGEDLRFVESGVRDTVRDVLLPWYNTYKFFALSVASLEERLPAGSKFAMASLDDVVAAVTKPDANAMDAWIVSASQSLVAFVRKEMEAYHLYTVVPRLVEFIGQLTNWYVRLNRLRLKGITGAAPDGDDESSSATSSVMSKGIDDCRMALSVLGHVLLTLASAMGPFTPFFAEYSFRQLRKVAPVEMDLPESVHFTEFPHPDDRLIQAHVERRVARMQAVVELGRVARDRRNASVKQPLRSLTVIHRDTEFLGDIQSLAQYMSSELNVQEIRVESREDEFVRTSLLPGAKFNRELKARGNAARAALDLLTDDQVRQALDSGEVELDMVAGAAAHAAATAAKKSNKKKAPAKKQPQQQAAPPVADEPATLKLSAREADELICVERKFSGDTKHTEASWSPATGALVLLDMTSDPALEQAYIIRQMTNRLQKARQKAGLTMMDRVELFYDSKDRALMETVSGGRAALERTVRGSVEPVSSRPRHAVVLFEEQTTVEDVAGKKSDMIVQVVRCAARTAPNADLVGRVTETGVADDAVADLVAAYIASLDYNRLLEEVRGQSGDTVVKQFILDGQKIRLTLNRDMFLSPCDQLDDK